MTGAYLYVQRDGQRVPIEIEHLTDDERREVLPRVDKGDGLWPWLHLCCHELVKVQAILDDLEADGILTREEEP